MRLIRSFTLCNLNASAIHEVNEIDIARLEKRHPHPDNQEVFALQIKADGPLLTLVGIVIARPQEATIVLHRPVRRTYGGHFFTMGEDLAKKQTGHAALDAFLDHIRKAYQLTDA